MTESITLRQVRMKGGSLAYNVELHTPGNVADFNCATFDDATAFAADLKALIMRHTNMAPVLLCP